MREIKQIIVHHSESPGGGVEFLRYCHVHDRGWRDVGYHYVICNGEGHGDWPGGLDGEVQTGRNLDEDIYLEWDEIGAHARGSNRDSIGICVIGRCDLHQPTHRQTRALMELCLSLCSLYHIDTSNILGHKDVNSTTCPGNELYKELPFIRTWLYWRSRGHEPIGEN